MNGGMRLGEEAERVDSRFATSISEIDRHRIWGSANRILDSHSGDRTTALALGYVQSGKTTSMAALCAAAADRGYSIVVALLGTTHLLVNQNRDRFTRALGLEEQNYRWYMQTRLAGTGARTELANWLRMGRVVLFPVLKNAAQIRKVGSLLAAQGLETRGRTLIIDDEGDQASLNTLKRKELESATYRAIRELVETCVTPLYVQYTATPYAPLLLEESDILSPTTVEVLEPGAGYTGGRELLVRFRESVVRELPITDENMPTSVAVLPESLRDALAAFVAGSAILISQDPASPPISMLVHATHRNETQARLQFLIDRHFAEMRNLGSRYIATSRERILRERDRLSSFGVTDIDDEVFWENVNRVHNECVTWLVNSRADTDQVVWNAAPFHVLVGGNKLDRGFTVEGLTVSYLSRKASEQIDTLEQRARAYGYRGDLVPFCQLFASRRTIMSLTGIVQTEDDMRASLVDWIDAGRTISEWARSVGLLLPGGTRPSRSTVIESVSEFNASGDWHSLRRPSLVERDIDANASLVDELKNGPFKPIDFGRISHPGLITTTGAVRDLLARWRIDPVSPTWRHAEILTLLGRLPPDGASLVLLLGQPGTDGGEPRVRMWREDVGFVNLFQGRDPDSTKGERYEGDRAAGLGVVGEESVVLQIHYIEHPQRQNVPLHTLALHLGSTKVVRRMREEETM